MAQGRFNELFRDLTDSVTKEPSLYQLQKYGQLICINILERSSTPKARLFALNECLICVDKVGITAVGKKGTSLVVKSLNDETISENRNAALDVIDMILTKINGDTKKLFKVCGKTNVSDKTKKLIEERWEKRHRHGDGCSVDSNGSSVKRAAQSPRAGPPIRLLTPRSRSSTPLTSFPSSRKQSITKSSLQRHDSMKKRRSVTERKQDSAKKNIAHTPSFKLKLDDSNPESNKSLQLTPSGPYRFSFTCDSARKSDHISSEAVHTQKCTKGISTPVNINLDPIQNRDDTKEASTPVSVRKNIFTADTPNSNASPNQAAADLRARLQHIREKRARTPTPASASISVSSKINDNRTIDSQSSVKLYNYSSSDLIRWDNIRDILNSVLCLATPLPDDNHPLLLKSGECLKKIHASVTQIKTDSSISEELRSDILSNASDCVKTLTR